MGAKPVVVVGGGIVGASIALHLVDRGAETILIERDAVPQGASAFSFASITAFDEPVRDVYLLKTLGMVGWHRWAERLEDDLGLRWAGEVRWAESLEAGRELRHKIEVAQQRGYPVRMLSEKALRMLVPETSPGPVMAACFAPEDGQVDALKVVVAARRVFEESGGRVMRGRASLRFEETGPEVRVAHQRIRPITVVVAAGAETMALAERLGWDIPMEPSPGFLAVTKPTRQIAQETVYVSPAAGPSIHLRQLDDGRVLIGERSQEHVVREPTTAHAQALLHQAARFFPSLAEAEVDHFTLEWRPMPRDGMPIIGPLPGLPSLYVATGHSGVTLAPAMGELVAEEIVEDRPATRLEPFRPARFGAHSMDAALSVEEAFSAAAPEVFLG